MGRFLLILTLIGAALPAYTQVSGNSKSENTGKSDNQEVKSKYDELMLGLKYATEERHMEQIIPLLEQLNEIPVETWRDILNAVHYTKFRDTRLYIIKKFLVLYPFDEFDTQGRAIFVEVLGDEFDYLLSKEFHSESELDSIKISLAVVEKHKMRELFYKAAAFIAYPLIDIRKLSYKALAKLEDDRMYPLLLQLADSPNPIERTYAVDAFYYIKDDRILPILIQLINDQNKTVRYYVIRTLENMNAVEAVPYIIRIVRSDVNNEVRVRAIGLLKKFKPRSAYPVLNQAVSDDSPKVRMAAIEALIEYNNRNSAYYISEQLEKEQVKELKLFEIQALLLLNHPGKMEGLNRIMENDNNRQILLWALYAAGKLKDSRGLNAILFNLKNPDKEVRAEAALALANLKNKRAVSYLMERLADEGEDYTVQAAALFAIFQIDDDSIIPELFELSENHKDPYLRKQIKNILRLMLRARFSK